MSQKVIYSLDDPRLYASRLDQGYIDIMVAAQYAREKGIISEKFATSFTALVSEACIRLKQKIEPVAATKRREHKHIKPIQ